MTVDLLAAAFWPEGTLFGPMHPRPHEMGSAPDRAPGHPEADAAAAPREGFWSALLRHLRRPSGIAALP